MEQYTQYMLRGQNLPTMFAHGNQLLTVGCLVFYCTLQWFCKRVGKGEMPALLSGHVCEIYPRGSVPIAMIRDHSLEWCTSTFPMTWSLVQCSKVWSRYQRLTL